MKNLKLLITLLFLILAASLQAQVYTINQQLKLNTVPAGVKADSILVVTSGGLVKRVPRSGVSSVTPDATTTTKGIVKLAGDLAGTADLPTVPGLATRVTANSPITGATNTKITYDSKGLITSGTSLIASDIPNILESQVTGLVSDLATKAIDVDVLHKNSNPETKIGGFTSGGVNKTYTSDQWLTFGTSVTNSLLYSTPASLQMQVTLVNFGVSGSNSNNLASQYVNIPTLTSGNMNSYRLLSVEHGINDSAGAIPLATYRANLEAFIANAKGKNWPNDKILVINSNYCTAAPMLTTLEAYANEAIAIAKEQGVQYVDIYNYTKNNGGGTILADGIHLLPEGGVVYARGLIASLQGGGEFTNALSVVNGLTVGGAILTKGFSSVVNSGSTTPFSYTNLSSLSGAYASSRITANDRLYDINVYGSTHSSTPNLIIHRIPGSTNFEINQQGSSRIYIHTGGNVSLGSSTNSGFKFDVNGTARISGLTTLTVAPIVSSETANTIASFDGTKNLKSLPLATYPSLTELAYAKGVTSSIQPQIDNKQPTITAGTTAQYYRGDKTMQDLNPAVIGSVLAGFSAGSGTVASTDTVLQAFNKLAGNQDLKANLAGTQTFTGVHNFPTASTGATGNQAATLDFVHDAINNDVTIQKIVDNPVNYANVDSGNSSIAVLVGSANERAFEVITGNGTERGLIQVDNNSSGFKSETATGTCELRASVGELAITQSSLSGITTIAAESPVSTTTWSTPAFSVTGGYKYASQPKEYLVSALPTPTGSDSRFAIVTDALAPSYMVAIVGGGTVVCPVFYNGSTWVAN